MFSPQNSIVAFVLVFGVLFCWGSWPHLRIQCKAPAPVFVLLYVPCQFATIMFLSLTLGMIRGDNGMFNEESFAGEVLHRPGNSVHIAFVLAAGVLNANGDFLCAVACSRLPGSVANLLYGGSALLQGTLFTFFVEKYDGNLVLLFSGLCTALLGVLSMSASDYCSVDPSTVISKLSVDFSNMPAEEYHYLQAEKSMKTSLITGDIEETRLGGRERESLKYIYLCVLAGVMTGSFAPLSVLASEGDGAVDNPYVLMFFFQIGQLLAIPLAIFYYTHLLSMETKNGSTWWFVADLFELPRRDVKYGCCAGMSVGLGFFLFFSASDVLPSTAVFAICNCCPLITIVIDVFVFGHLDRATVWQTRFMALSASLFMIAIAQMIMAQSI